MKQTRLGLLTLLVTLVMLVTLTGCYERRNRRRRTTTIVPTTSPNPEFDEVNVVRFNRNRWRQEDSGDAEDVQVNTENNEDFFGRGEGESTTNWLNSIFDESRDGDMEVERNKENEGNGHNSYNSLFPSSVFFGSSLNPNPDSFGANVCQQRREERTSNNHGHVKFISTSCSVINGFLQCNESSSMNGILKRVVNTWSCCEGFSKDASMEGCPIVEKESNLECLQYSNMTEFIAAFATFDLNSYLTSHNTILAPDDQTLNEYKKALDKHTGNVLEITPEMVTAATQIRDRLLTHILPTTISITDFTGTKRVATVDNNSHVFFYRHSPIRVQLTDLDVSVNCKPLDPIYMNSEDGRVYILKGFLKPLKKSFKEIIEENSNAKIFLELLESLNVSDVSSVGRSIFVPTDQAFEGLSEWARDNIKNNALEVLKSLSTQYPLCPHQFNHVTAIKANNGDLISLSKEDDIVKLNTAILEGTERISIEGTIVYFIDSFPNADALLPPSELARKLGASKFADLMKSSNFQEVRDYKFSLVVPSDEAMQNFEDSDNAEELLKYHTIVSPIEESGFLETDLEQNKVYYRRFLLDDKMKKLIQCIPLKEHKASVGYSLFTTDRILPKTKGNLFQLIENDDKFSTFCELLKIAEIESELRDTDNRITLLAVDDEAFSDVPERTVRRLKNSRNEARAFLMNHMLTTDFCMNDPSDEFMASLQTYSGRFVQWVAKDGEVKVAGKVVRRGESDRMASNGVMHVINGPIFQRYTPRIYFTFYDI